MEGRGVRPCQSVVKISPVCASHEASPQDITHTHTHTHITVLKQECIRMLLWQKSEARVNK